MRWSKDRTTTAFLMMLAISSVVGCSKGGNSPPAKLADKEVSIPTPTGSARLKAEELLKALADGKAKPTDLTAAFKKSIAKPLTDEDKKVGYSETDLNNWLAKFEKLTVEDVKETTYGNTIVLRGRAKTPGKIDAFCLRMVKENNTYVVDWLHRSDRFLAGDAPKVDDPELVAASDTARNFLETLIGGDLRQAQALMLPTWLTAIEPPSDADKKLGFNYNLGFVTQKMRSWRGDTIAYAIPKAELTGNKDIAMVTAEFQEEAGKKKTYLVKLVKDKTTGQWLVDDFTKA